MTVAGSVQAALCRVRRALEETLALRHTLHKALYVMEHEVISTREAERRSLLARIESAFRDVRLGGGASLHQARAMDDYESAETIAAVRALDPEERWQDISDQKLDRLSDTLPFMDAEGFRFHIPRFMIFALRNEASGSWARATAIYWSDMQQRPGKYLTLLSEEQRQVIRAFSEFHAGLNQT